MCTSFCSEPMTNMLWSLKNSSMARLIGLLTPYLKPMNLRASTFESSGEEILPNSPSVSSSIDSSVILIPLVEEPLESHINSDHHGDNPLNHPSILHQQPNPLDIVIGQPQCYLGKHQFIISESTLWYSDTMYANP